MPFCPSLMLLIITVILPTRSAMLISPANTRGSTVAWSIQRAAPEPEPAHRLPSNYLLASPGGRIPVPSQRAGVLGDANPRRCWLASVWSGTAVRASTSPREKKGSVFREKPMFSGGGSCKVGTIPVLRGSDGLRPPWRQAGQGGKALDIIPLTSPEESRENLFLQKEGGRFPLETEALMKGRGQKMGRNDC